MRLFAGATSKSSGNAHLVQLIIPTRSAVRRRPFDRLVHCYPWGGCCSPMLRCARGMNVAAGAARQGASGTMQLVMQLAKCVVRCDRLLERLMCLHWSGGNCSDHGDDDRRGRRRGINMLSRVPQPSERSAVGVLNNFPVNCGDRDLFPSAG